MGSDVGFLEEVELPSFKIDNINDTESYQNIETTPRKGNKGRRKKGIRIMTREGYAHRRLIELEDSDSEDGFSNSTVSKHIFEYANTIY